MSAVFDAHLDLAFNAALGRDLTQPLPLLRSHDPVAHQTACVTFGELKRAGVGACFGTLFAAPASADFPAGYENWQGARRQALAQLDQYRHWEDSEHIRLLSSGAELKEHLDGWDDQRPLGVVLLMEGADPLRDADDLPFWHEAGVRLIGPAWGRTRYAGGTDAPGPLTDRGRDLLIAMRDLNITLDASHLDDESFWEALELQPQVIASHSNSRAFVPGNRHLSDDMARAITERGGVIGLVALSSFIRAGWKESDTRASFAQWAEHAEHYAGLGGWDRIGLGTDLDGGFGLEKALDGMKRYSDVLHLLDEVPENEREGVRGQNWRRWAEEHL
ncbi:membrane dipeptidase [Deinococcus sp. KNUC1210]|uniref:dipeptidase n=1 Tax=Deinococcus sp. KNUC1210 TaxID=2917691 RepID=UPI001EF0DAD6|nr:membrane dipeptidase [Deinococcus sp. KNUC1210]ULH15828.1 membrane dipeptidase [Deinococcus sp. KNUC1210]